MTELEKAIINILDTDCEPSERTFPVIQNRLSYNYPRIGCDQNGFFDRGYTEQDIFNVLLGLRQKYGIILTTSEIKNLVNIGNLSLREGEVFGLACRDVKELEKTLRTPGEKKLDILSKGDRGYVFYLETGGKPSVVKGFQGKDEPSIAMHVSKVGLGPVVYGLGRDFLFEEYIDGEAVCCGKDAPLIGHLVGNFFGRLHKERITLNHHRFPYEMSWNPVKADLRMIDFGTAAYSSDRSEDIKYIEEFFVEIDNGQAARKAFIEEYSLRLKV